MIDKMIHEFEAGQGEPKQNQSEPHLLCLDDLKAAAKQVPFDEYAVEATQLPIRRQVKN
jgi:hypothetical protein